MFEGHDRLIFEIVRAGGLVGKQALADLFAGQERSGRPFADLVLERGLVGEGGLFRAIADHLGRAFVSAPATVPHEVAAQVDGALARKFGAVPVALEGDTLTVITLDPLGACVEADLTFALGREVRLAMADPRAVAALLTQLYGTADEAAEPAGGEREAALSGREELSPAEIEKMAAQPPVIRFVNQILARAISDHASDIHFEPFEREFKIRCRVDGSLFEIDPPAKALALPITSRLKVLSGLDIAERRIPQDGRIKLSVSGRAVDLRVSTLPTQYGESVVLRVLDQSAVRLELPQLGLPAPLEKSVRDIIARPHGILLVTGPTGSGKTTTLYSCLHILNSIEAKLLTVEDPVEYEVDGIMQVPVNPAAGLTFARALRAFLRQDPDIVMVGEIRDLATAQIAIQAALTGHLVLSTLHTNDAPGTIARLVDLGVEPFLLASTVSAVLAQRLVRRLCPACREAYDPPAALLRDLGIDPAAVERRPFHRARGCDACQQSGYRGRLGIFELLVMNDELRDLVVAQAPAATLRLRATGLGLVSLREAGVQAVLAGETTAGEILKYT